MSLDLLRARVVLRDRPLSDVLDLALRFLTLEARVYGAVAAVVLPPAFLLTMAALSWWGALGGAAVALGLWFAAEVPFTLLASRLVWRDDVTAGEVLRDAARELPRLIAMRLVWAAAIAAASVVFIVPAAWAAASMLYLGEVMLLERAPLGTAFGRSHRVSASSFGDAIAGAGLGLLLPLAGLFLAEWAGGVLLTEGLQIRLPAAATGEVGAAWRPSALGVLGLFALLPFATTARFFVYLNARTRAEGWDIQTRFAALAARATGALAILLALAAPLLYASRADAQEIDPETARAHVEDARRETSGFSRPGYSFCAPPSGRGARASGGDPLGPRQRALCPLVQELDACEGLAAACRESRAPPPREEATRGSSALGVIGRVVLWALVAAAVLAVLLPVVRAFARARRDRAVADPTRPAAAATRGPDLAAPETPAISDADAALRAADDLARRGEHARAISLYLAACLFALERRGAVRLARYRTNGEYVRLCAEADAKEPLRAIVREVDRIEFGHAAPTPETTATIAARAATVVRASAGAAARAASGAVTIVGALLIATALASTLTGCSAPGDGAKGGDPAGDELPREILRRSGYQVSSLTTSLATMPMPARDAAAPVLVVDVTRVSLEEESEAHLLRWVDGGGVLVLFGPARGWPHGLRSEGAPEALPTDAPATERDLTVASGSVRADGARVAVPRALSWAGATPVAHLGDAVYAARVTRGAGTVLGVAGDDLLTNVGVASPANAVALVALIEAARHARYDDAFIEGLGDVGLFAVAPASLHLHIARAEDGIPPPSSPLSSLARAGLGKAAWHALAACLLLFLAYGIRHARPRTSPPPTRRAFAEHVVATGAFYRRARAFGHALAAYGRWAEAKLFERLPRGADPITFLAQRTGRPRDEIERVWKRAREASATDPLRGDELATIRDLRALLAKALES